MSVGKINLGLWAVMLVDKLTLLGQRIVWPVSLPKCWMA